MRSLGGSAVVVTGASGGIGRAAALAFAAGGADVVLAARSEEGLEATRQACEARGVRAVPVPTDVSQEAEVGDLVARAVEAFGRIDVWVNNAAVLALGSFLDTPPDVFRRVLETNLLGYCHGARAALGQFLVQGRGVLVNVSSLLGKMGAPNMSAYVAAKFAVEGLSECLRQEFVRHRRIHVCNVLPGGVDTPLYVHAANFSGRRPSPSYPLAPAEDVARAIVGCALRPRREVRIGGTARLQEFLHRRAPGLYERLGGRLGEAVEFAGEPAPATRGNLFSPARRVELDRGGPAEGSPSGGSRRC